MVKQNIFMNIFTIHLYLFTLLYGGFQGFIIFLHLNMINFD